MRARKTEVRSGEEEHGEDEEKKKHGGTANRKPYNGATFFGV